MIVRYCFVRFLVIRIFIQQLLVLNVFAEFETIFKHHFNIIDNILSNIQINNASLVTPLIASKIATSHASEGAIILSIDKLISLVANETTTTAASLNANKYKADNKLFLSNKQHRISKRQAPFGIVGLALAIVSLVITLSVVVVLFTVSMVALGILNQVLTVLRQALSVLFFSLHDIFPVLAFVLFKHKEIKLGILQSFHHFDRYLLSKCVDIREYPKFFKLYTKFYKILVDKLLNKNKLKCLGPKCVTNIVGTLNAKLYSMKAEIINLERQISKLIPQNNSYTKPFENMPVKPYEPKIYHKVIPKHLEPFKRIVPPNIAQCMIDNSKNNIFYEDYYV